jgi:hypothetical protein
MKIIYLLLLLLVAASCSLKTIVNNDDFILDHRYAPSRGQTLICMPDETQKTLVDNNGALLYDYFNGGPIYGFNIMVKPSVDSSEFRAESQTLYSPEVPIVITEFKKGKIRLTTEIFSAAPALDSDPRDTCELSKSFNGMPHNDLVISTFRNTSDRDTSITPSIIIASSYPVNLSIDKKLLTIDGRITITLPGKVVSQTQNKSGLMFKYVFTFNPELLRAVDKKTLVCSVNIGKKAAHHVLSADEAGELKSKAISWWNSYNFPYDRISVPDSNVQKLLHSCIRNIFQAREIKRGLPAFEVGPTCYRGLWIIDGSFLLESMTYLGQAEDVRNGVEYMLGFQKKNGSVLLMDKHWKETGIVLWVIKRHAQLTGDVNWLSSKWDNVTRAVGFIDSMRYSTMKDKNAPNYGLIPQGFSDGGLAKVTYEFTNVYWTLNGMKSAAEIATMLNRTKEAELWKSKYDSMFTCYETAARKSLRTDSCGNRAVPTFMTDFCQIQRGQWAFCQAVFPGRNFKNDDEMVRGTMNMLQCNEKEGLVYETGWLSKGVWNYFGSFYAHAWLWLGNGMKAAQTMYAMANHSSSTLVWREEQPLKSSTSDDMVGDMPHNWASAEFIRMMRHFIALERGTELHLFEGLPPTWTRPGMKTSLKGIYTEFGKLTLDLTISEDGKQAVLNIDLASENHKAPTSVEIHLDGLKGIHSSLSLKPVFPVKETIRL